MGKKNTMKTIPFNLIPQLKFVAKVAKADYEALRSQIFQQVKFLGIAWCNPMNIEKSTRYFVNKQGGFLLSAKELPKEYMTHLDGTFIAAGDWDIHTTTLYDVKHIARATRHFETGESWDDVGEIEWMMQNISKFGVQDGCRNLDEVIARCAGLDKIFNNTMKCHRILTRKELTKRNFREMHGIGVAIGRNGDVIWFNDGAHRLAIAKHLKLEEIPVCVHLVHAEAVRNNKLMKNIYTEPKHQ